MANTYTQIYIHVVFAVKRRESLLEKSWRDELFKYITGIITTDSQKLFIINGVEDHIHILISIDPSKAISDIVRDIKSNSSRWINQKKLTKQNFEWQSGYGAFSVSGDHLKNTIRYIERQEEHHSKKSFKQEYIKLLELYEIEYKEQYLFTWFED